RDQLRSRRKPGTDGGNPAGIWEAIGVGPPNVSRTGLDREAEARIRRGPGPLLRLLNQMPAEDGAYGEHLPNHFGAAIRAAVIHQEQREVAVTLRRQGRQRRPYSRGL